MITLICVEPRSPSYAEVPALTWLRRQTQKPLAAKDACLLGIKGIFPARVTASLFGSGGPPIRVMAPSRQQAAGRRPSYINGHKCKSAALAATIKRSGLNVVLKWSENEK